MVVEGNDVMKTYDDIIVKEMREVIHSCVNTLFDSDIYAAEANNDLINKIESAGYIVGRSI